MLTAACNLTLNDMLQFAMFVCSSSVTMVIVFLVVMYVMVIVHAVMEATNEIVVSVHEISVNVYASIAV